MFKWRVDRILKSPILHIIFLRIRCESPLFLIFAIHFRKIDGNRSNNRGSIRIIRKR